MEMGELRADYLHPPAPVHRLGACDMDNLLVIFDKHNVRALYELISNGCDVNAIYRRFERGKTPVRTTHTCLLQMAIERKWMTGLTMLINAGACIEGPTFFGDAGSWRRHQYRNPTRTPLMVAAEVGDVDALQLLIDAGGDVNALDDITGDTALRLAIVSQSTACVMLLLEMGAAVNAIGKPYAAVSPEGEAFHMPITALTGAIRNFKSADDQIKEIANDECHIRDNMHIHSSEISERECYKKTLWLNVIEMLIERGANINFDGMSTDCSPLVESLECRDTSILELLLQNKVFINKESHVVLLNEPLVNSAFSLAFYLNNVRGLELLIENGARVNDLPVSVVEHSIRQMSYQCLYYCLQAGYAIYPSSVQLLRNVAARAQCDDADKICHTNNNDVINCGVCHDATHDEVKRKENDDQLLFQIVEFIQQPKPLQWLCRHSTRRALQNDTADSMTQLCLPKHLKDYLMFRRL